MAGRRIRVPLPSTLVCPSLRFFDLRGGGRGGGRISVADPTGGPGCDISKADLIIMASDDDSGLSEIAASIA